jgi:hypothetical protein
VSAGDVTGPGVPVERSHVLATTAGRGAADRHGLAPPRPPRRVAVWIAVTVTVAHLGLTRGHFIGTDEISAYQMTRSLWERGDLTVGYIVNTFPGRDGKVYSQYGVGQSVAALPLYALGKAVRLGLERAGRPDWVHTLAGRSIGQEPSRWGGDVEIFFVNLFNCFATGLLCAVFFALTCRLGASVRSAAIGALLVGFATYVAPFSVGFLRHTGEALFVVWALYFLVCDGERPHWRSRAAAGAMMGLGLHFRTASVATWPVLGLYLLVSIWRRRAPAEWARRAGILRRALGEALPLAAPIAVAVGLHAAVEWIRFESIWGKYNNEGFHTPLVTGLYAFLLSPGDSIFLFSPLLLLAPWLLRDLWRRGRVAEAAALAALAVTYLCFYGKYTAWHGLWSALGPRYLVPVTPLLLLPLGAWLDRRGRSGWAAVLPLALLGLAIQAVHVAVNFAYVYHFEKYVDWNPPYGFLFIPDRAPIVAHARALLAADYRVDMWLIHVWREIGAGRALGLAGLWLVAVGLCAWRLGRAVRAAGVPRPSTV